MYPPEEFDDRDHTSRPRRDPHDGYHDDRRRSWPSDRPPQTSVVGIIGLVIGTAGLTISFIPCIGVVGMVGGAIGLLLGLVGLLEVRNSAGRVSNGVPLASVVIGVAALLVGGFWLALMAGAFRNNNPPADPVPGAADEKHTSVTAVDLNREYDWNEEAANEKYRHELIEVSGRVKRVADDVVPGKVALVLEGAAGSTVNCVFPLSEKPNLSHLTPGDEVVASGRCAGRVKGTVTVEDCTRFTGPKERNARDDAPLTVQVDALVRDYADDADTADRKYKGRVLEVTGRLGPIERNAGRVTAAVQDPGGTDLVACEFTAEGAKRLASVKPGRTVTVRGRCRGTVDDVPTLSDCTVVK